MAERSPDPPAPPPAVVPPEIVRTPLLGLSVNGAGDAIAALFLAHWLDTRSAAEALGRAAASVSAQMSIHRARDARRLARRDQHLRPRTRHSARPS